MQAPPAGTVWAPLLAPLPDTVHLMSLEPAPTRAPLEGGRVLVLRYAAAASMALVAAPRSPHADARGTLALPLLGAPAWSIWR